MTRSFFVLITLVMLGLFAAGYKSGLDRRHSDPAIIAGSLEKAQVLRSDDGKFAVALSCGKDAPDFAYLGPLEEPPQFSVHKSLLASLAAGGRAVIGPASNFVRNPVFEAGVAGASVAELGKAGLKNLREEAFASKASRAVVRFKWLGFLIVGAGGGYYLGDWLAGLPPACGSPEALSPLQLTKNQADLERSLFKYDYDLISSLNCTPKVARFKVNSSNPIMASVVDKCTKIRELMKRDIIRAVEQIHSDRDGINDELESAASIAANSEYNSLQGRMKNSEFSPLWNRCEAYRKQAGRPICFFFR